MTLNALSVALEDERERALASADRAKREYNALAAKAESDMRGAQEQFAKDVSVEALIRIMRGSS